MPKVQIQEVEAKDTDLVSPRGPLGDAHYAAATDVRQKFAAFANMSRNLGQMTLITERQKPAAALVSVSDYRILRILDAAGYKDKLAELSYEKLVDGIRRTEPHSELDSVQILALYKSVATFECRTHPSRFNH